MTAIQQTYLQLLRQATGLDSLNANRSTLDVDCTLNDTAWQQLVHLAQIQGTAPLIFNELLSLPSRGSVSPDETGENNSRKGEIIGALRSVCMRNMVAQEGLLRILKQTFTALLSGGIHPVLLKGFGLAALYPKPYLRTWGDLDVYVGPEQYHQAAEILRNTYPEAKHPKEEWEELKHYNFDLPDGNAIEMHRDTVKMELPRERRVYEALERQGCFVESRVERVENIEVPVPEAKFNMLFSFLHAWNHFVESGVGFKQLCDVALLAHKISQESRVESREWSEYTEYMQRNLRKLHLMQPWQLIGYVCVEYLGLPAGEWPLLWCTVDNAQCTMQWSRWLQKHGERFAQRVMAEGCARPTNYPKGENHDTMRQKAKQMNIIARKWLTFKERFRVVQLVYPYAPAYACHLLWEILYRGIRRTIRREKMLDY